MLQNSKYYSAVAPRRLRTEVPGSTLPHMTIQIPVYKEGLRSVIAPTIQSIKQAISTYEMQGGTANMFVNDDGSKCTILKTLSVNAKQRSATYL
jgi:hypothetical protein